MLKAAGDDKVVSKGPIANGKVSEGHLKDAADHMTYVGVDEKASAALAFEVG